MKYVIAAVLAVAAIFGVVTTSRAAVNAVTPSTNDKNRTNGWAHVDLISATTDSIKLKFVNTRSFWSCFEYRVDDEPNTVPGPNPNTGILDGRWTEVCLNSSDVTKTIPVEHYADVRMVYGAEKDERFDWTRFDALFVRTAEITSPAENASVFGTVSFDATLDDKDGDDTVQWAVRKDTCDSGQGTVFGNVDGFHDSSDWDGATFHSTADTSNWTPGMYCFVFNPTESSGDTPIRLTRWFNVVETVGPPHDKNECKKDGWMSFNSPSFKNQGDCVSYVQSNEQAKGNKEK